MYDYYVVEFSTRQKFFHISTFKESIESNIRTALNNIDNDYKIIGIFETYEQANDFCNQYRNKFGALTLEEAYNIII